MDNFSLIHTIHLVQLVLLRFDIVHFIYAFAYPGAGQFILMRSGYREDNLAANENKAKQDRRKCTWVNAFRKAITHINYGTQLVHARPCGVQPLLHLLDRYIVLLFFSCSAPEAMLSGCLQPVTEKSCPKRLLHMYRHLLWGERACGNLRREAFRIENLKASIATTRQNLLWLIETELDKDFSNSSFT